MTAHTIPTSLSVLQRTAPLADVRSTTLAAPDTQQRLEDLAGIINAYHQATENLQKSHEQLVGQVERLQQQLADADAQLQRSRRLAALGEMAAGIAHEIRNPLGAIQLYSGMMQQDLTTIAQGNADDAATALHNADDTAKKISSAVRGLNAIVTDVVAFAREITPRPSTQFVSQLFDRALDVLAPTLATSHIHIHRLDCNEITCDADPELLHQALLNLIRNAADAVAENRDISQKKRIITLDARSEHASTILIIRDNGAGIAAENIDRIFNPFFTTRSTGTGLGLAIVHRLIDAHGGTIAVRNDHGAIFEIRLPAHQPSTGDCV